VVKRSGGHSGTPPTIGVGSHAPAATTRSHFSVDFLLLWLFSFVCTFSLFLLLTALHAIDYVTRLLPARSLNILKLSRNLEEEKGHRRSGGGINAQPRCIE